VQLREAAGAGDPIIAVAAEHQVRAVARVDDVIAPEADDAIGAGRAGQHVIV
jgi:hypothetical protein